MQGKDLVDEPVNRQVGFEGHRRGHRLGDGGGLLGARALDHAGGGAQQEQSHQDRPKSHKVRTEGRREGHVESKHDQDRGDQLAAETGDARGVVDVAAAFPDNRAQHAAAIERIAGK